MRTALQYASIAGIFFFANVAGQFSFLWLKTGNSVAFAISLFCLLVSALIVFLRSKLSS